MAARVFLDYDRIELFDDEHSFAEDRYNTIGSLIGGISDEQIKMVRAQTGFRPIIFYKSRIKDILYNILRRRKMPVSKYYDIYLDIKRKIEKGLYLKGSYLPSEYTLIEEYHCSRNTVGGAIGQLADEGYVQSMHGKGVVVIWMSEQQSLFSIGSIESMREAAERNHMTYRTKVIAFDKVTADHELCQRTGFDPGKELLLTWTGNYTMIWGMDVLLCIFASLMSMRISSNG